MTADRVRSHRCPLALFLVPILTVLLLLLTSLPCQAQPEAGVLGDWIPTFADEFDGNVLDTTKWTPSTGVFVNREETVHYFLPQNVTVADGLLRIHSRRETFRNPRDTHVYSFTSGEIRTLGKFAQRYGRFEIRCRFPRTPGIWSAFYLLPDDDSWPPEIDITEYIGQRPFRLYLTHHWKGIGGEHEQQGTHFEPGGLNLQDWHVYSVEWEPGVLRRFVDGKLCGTSDVGIADIPLYLRLNTAVGGVFAGAPAAGPWPQTYEIDYVRVYRRPDQPPPGPPSRISIAALKQSASAARIDTRPEPATRGFFWDNLGLVFLLVVVPVGYLVTVRSPQREARRTRLLGIAVGVSGVNYIVWRFGVIGWNWSVAIPFLLAELFGLVQMIGFLSTIWPRSEPKIVPGEDPLQRSVFILIPTVNEGVEILEPTLRGALGAQARYVEAHPESVVKIVICNDGRVANVDGWQEVERLAERLGVLCVTRTAGGGAKAGNIEFARQAVGATGDALIAIFDADMAAEPEFLLRTVPPFADPTIGWVQTGQYYRNRDNPIARWADDQQALFYSAICPGKARLNAGFICGTNVVIRASALDGIGGLPQNSITEDIAASILLHHRHWRGIYLTDVLATGLGPSDIAAYFAQQRRWATGVFGVLLRHGRLIFLPFPRPGGLSAAQRIQYFLSCTHYLSGVCNLVYILVPLLFFYLGSCAVRPVAAGTLFSYLLPYWLLSLIAFRHASGGRLHWRGTVLGFGSFPVTVASLLSVLGGQRARFVVTSKKRRDNDKSPAALRPHRFVLFFCLGGLLLSFSAKGNALLVLLTVIWLLQMTVMLAALIFGASRQK